MTTRLPNDPEELIDTIPARCSAFPIAPDRLALWWCFWLQLAPADARAWLDAWLGDAAPESAYAVVEAICNQMYAWDEGYVPFSVGAFQDLDTLKWFAPIVYRHIDPENDTRHRGAYSPSSRDHAQSIRAKVISSLAAIPGEATSEALRLLAATPLMAGRRDWLLSLADRRDSSNDPCAPMNVADALQWMSAFGLAATDSNKLFQVALHRLDDLKHEIELADHSYRKIFTAQGSDIEEVEVAKWIAAELSKTSRSQYSTTREEEVQNQNRTDIRLHNPVNAAVSTIEVKIAGRWSYAMLDDALRNQLDGKYLKDHGSKHGVFLLCAVGLQTTWRPKGENPLTFEQLVVGLQNVANSVVADGLAIGLQVMGIDFRTPV